MRNHCVDGKPRDASRLWSVQSLFGVLLAASYCASGASIAAAADGGALFEANCSACHTMGAGPKVGPDLKGAIASRGKEWVIHAILDPKKAGLGPIMPTLGLTQAEAEAISVYLDKASASSAAAGKEPPAPAEKQAEAEVTPQEVGMGRKLFEGSVRFTNGGPACNACHHVNYQAVTGGGILATDLSLAFSHMGKQGLDAILANPPFPVMQVAYGGKPISPEEIRALAGFLQRVEKESASQQPGSEGWRMFFGGAGGVVVLAGLFSLMGSHRKKRCVNQDIYDRQVKSE